MTWKIKIALNKFLPEQIHVDWFKENRLNLIANVNFKISMQKSKSATITEYINSAPPEAREKLKELRAILQEVAPEAKESIKWGSPVFEENRILFAFAAFKSHLNFMPTPSALEPFKEQLAKYNTGKGSIQFPYDKPLPRALIRKIAEFRARDVRENDARWM